MLKKQITTEDIKYWTKKIFKEYPFLKKKIYKATSDYTENTEELLEETLRFLFLITKYNQTLTPSISVDLAWHEFILFTKLYQTFCDEHFGRFIHHNPDESKESNTNNYKKTIQLYILTFGEPKKDYWGEYASSEWKSSQCGSCEAN